MKKLLKNAIIDIKKIKYDGDKKLSNAIQENIKSLIIKNAHKFENEEILKIIEKYNKNNCKDDQILKCSYDVFKNNVHRYSFDQINRILRLYNKSQINDNNFNTSIFNYIVKRLNAIPLSITVNVFNSKKQKGKNTIMWDTNICICILFVIVLFWFLYVSIDTVVGNVF